MSYVHKNEFERIKREHFAVVTLLTSAAKKRQKTKTALRSLSSEGIPLFDRDVLESAIATADDAYAMLLIAKSERFMLTYLDSMSIPLGAEPKLSMLIDKCRKEFNKSKPRIPMSLACAEDVRDLRVQRNKYAHGDGSSAFPSVAAIVIILGRFFDQLP